MGTSPREREDCLRRAREVSSSSEEVKLRCFEWKVYKALRIVSDGLRMRQGCGLWTVQRWRDGSMQTPLHPNAALCPLVTKGDSVSLIRTAPHLCPLFSPLIDHLRRSQPYLSSLPHLRLSQPSSKSCSVPWSLLL